MLDGGISRLRRAKRALMWASEASSCTSGTPARSASPCRVRSSAVGPRPPVATMTSARSHACRKTRTLSVRWSPTVVWNATGTPISSSRSASHWLLVSSRWPVVSSSPMEMISARIEGKNSKNRRTKGSELVFAVPFGEELFKEAFEVCVTFGGEALARGGAHAILEQEQLLIEMVDCGAGIFFVSLERGVRLRRDGGVIKGAALVTAIGECAGDSDGAEGVQAVGVLHALALDCAHGRIDAGAFER